MHASLSLNFGTLPSLVDLGGKLVHRLVVFEGPCLFKKDFHTVASSRPGLECGEQETPGVFHLTSGNLAGFGLTGHRVRRELQETGGGLQGQSFGHRRAQRALTEATEAFLPIRRATYVAEDGGLLWNELLDGFMAYWKENGESMLRRQPYSEAASQLVLSAWLHRIVNGGAEVETQPAGVAAIDREYAVGSGRVDLLVRWPLPEGGKIGTRPSSGAPLTAQKPLERPVFRAEWLENGADKSRSETAGRRGRDDARRRRPA